jgi:hypothetical protein
MEVVFSFILWVPLPCYQLKADPSTVQELCKKTPNLCTGFWTLAIQSHYCLDYTRNLNNLIFNRLKLNNRTLHKQVPQIENPWASTTLPPSYFPPFTSTHLALQFTLIMMTMKNNDNDHINFASYRRFGLVNIGQRKVTGNTTFRRQ